MDINRPGFVRVVRWPVAGCRPVWVGHGRATGTVLLLWLCTSVLAGQLPGPPAARQVPALGGAARDAAAVDLALQAAMKQTSARAASVALVRGPDLAYAGAFGGRVGTKSPANRHTVFRAASLGKPVFAYLALTLVADGRLDLDRPILSVSREARVRVCRVRRPGRRFPGPVHHGPPRALAPSRASELALASRGPEAARRVQPG